MPSTLPLVDDTLAPPTETIKAREEHIRESWVRAMEARIVRTELQKCYRGEGVNHLENCRELAEKYTAMIRDNKVSFVLCCHGMRANKVLASAKWYGNND